ncbi:hypothetical protein LA080_014833 [Diaporthe eres]|nr:hypothetical protein LA080_014833 [Diaporthe eres]
MSPNKSIPTPEAREASTITTEEIPLSGGPYEVGVELEDDDRGTLPEDEGEPGRYVLRECLETMERDRLEAGARRTKCPTLMERYCLIRLSEFIKSVLLVFINQQVWGVQGVLRSLGLFETIIYKTYLINPVVLCSVSSRPDLKDG